MNDQWGSYSAPSLIQRTSSSFCAAVSDFFEAVRQGPWKYRLRTSAEEAELYHVDRDPSEMYNVIDRYPDIARKLETDLRAKAKLYGARLRDAR